MLMKDAEINPLALDANKWLKLIEEIESPRNADLWRKYIEEYDFEVILPDLVLKEIVGLFAREDKPRIWKEKSVLRLMKSGQIFAFRFIKTLRDIRYYYLKAEMLMKKHKIRSILKARGLFTCVNGVEEYALHNHDLAILISLRELGRPYYFITHDNSLKEALEVLEIRRLLVSEGIHFILLHETQKAKDRQVRRIKILPAKI